MYLYNGLFCLEGNGFYSYLVQDPPPLFLQFIDDIIGVWVPQGPDTFEDFKSELQNFGPGLLYCFFRNLLDEVVILDLRMQIFNRRHCATTSEKELNLYAYVPEHSAHSPKLLCTLVIDQLLRYHRQCSCLEDCKKNPDNSSNVFWIMARLLKG